MALHTVSYNNNTGSGVIADGEGSSGQPFVFDLGTDFTKSGYVLTGWNTVADGSGTEYTLGQEIEYDVDDDLTVYAIWTVNEYTISFVSNGGTAVADITEDFGTDVSAPTAPTKAGYTFAAWYTEEALTNVYTFTTMPAADTELFAKWTVNTYTVSYDANDGTGTVANGTATYGVTFTLSDGTGLTEPSGFGDIYKWNTEADGTGTDYALEHEFTAYNIVGNLTLYAIYIPYFLYATNGTDTLKIVKMTEAGKAVYAELSIPETTLGLSITEIADNAFANYPQLTTLTIPKTITKIGACAFANCHNLATLTFAEDSTLVEIGDNAFFNALALDEIVLPDTLIKIGSGAFVGIPLLKEIVIPESVTSIGQSAFGGLRTLEIHCVAETPAKQWFSTWNGHCRVVYDSTGTSAG